MPDGFNVNAVSFLLQKVYNYSNQTCSMSGLLSLLRRQKFAN